MTGKGEAPSSGLGGRVEAKASCLKPLRDTFECSHLLLSAAFPQARQQPGERRDQDVPQQPQDLAGNRRPGYRYSAALNVAFGDVCVELGTRSNAHVKLVVSVFLL